MKRIHTMLIGISLLAGSSVGAQAAEPVFPGASTIGLVPPPAMAASGRFAGFESDRGASILFSELPAYAYAGVLAKFTPDGLKSSGFIASAPPVDWSVPGGQQAKLMRGTQVTQGTTYNKWILLAGGPAATAVVTVQVPDSASDALPADVVEEALRTVAFRAPLGIDAQVGALPFRVGDQAGFRPVRVIAGATLLLTEGPSDTVSDPRQPLVVVASSFSGNPALATDEQRRQFAQRAFAAIAGLTDIRVESETLGRSGRVDWVRIAGTATDSKSGAVMYVSQTMRFEAAGYTRTVATVRASEKAKLAARFQRLADSVARN